MSKETPKLYDRSWAVFKARHHAGMTQLELAKAIGSNQSAVSKRELGVVDVSMDYVREVCFITGVSIKSVLPDYKPIRAGKKPIKPPPGPIHGPGKKSKK